jgi:hypothetical protein
MLNLVGVFIKEDPVEKFNEETVVYPFSLIFPNKERTFYLSKEVKFNYLNIE